MSSNQNRNTLEKISAGARFRKALSEESPLQIVGTINAYSALLAEQAGYKSIYLSGAGVANASFGLPDLAITTLNDVVVDASRITDCTDLPLLVDIDTGWGGAFNIQRTVKDLQKVGVAAVHMEDQISQKRCGHRPNKQIVSAEEMQDRIKAAVDAKVDSDFFIMARTDAYAIDGLDEVIRRIKLYQEAGADGIFAEAMHSLEQYQAITSAVDIPVLANITEFGETPLYTVSQLGSAGIGMALYPLSAFRAMSKAAIKIFKAIRNDGTQQSVLEDMQTRKELYDCLGYHDFEDKLDKLN